MKVTTIALSTLGTAALLLTGVGGMGSANASVAQSSGASAAALPGSLCDIQVSRVKALDVRDNSDGVDRIRMRIGDKTSVTRTYTAGQVRNVLSDNTYDPFTSPELVKLVELDSGTVIGSASIPCVNRTATSLVSTPSGGAIYEVTWDVDVLVP